VFVVSDHGNEIADCFLEKRLANRYILISTLKENLELWKV